MLVYAPSISPRFRYIADFIGRELCMGPFEITMDRELFLSSPHPGINYSDERIGVNELWIKPHTLLFETGIQPQHTEIFDGGGHKAFFKTTGDLLFDIFAASFYLLSRYEEYLPHQKDMYGRYAYENSLAYKENFLDKPLINIWLEALKITILQKWPGLPFRHQRFRFLPTYDIDEAYSYKYKNILRTMGGVVKDLLKGNKEAVQLRRTVRSNQAPDPFDAYDWMDDLHREHKLEPRYFFLVAERTGQYDKNILPGEPAMQTLIKRHAGKYSIGIHPSWRSGDDTSLIKKEITTLEKIAGTAIHSSRQHFIRFTLPVTFRYLTEEGIKEDFSMGYGSINGFRASVASSFYWYDLEKEQATGLQLYPFCYMEANSFFEQSMKPEEAWEEVLHYYQEVKNVNGLLITIWHNTFLGTAKKFNGWRDIYQKFIENLNGS